MKLGRIHRSAHRIPRKQLHKRMGIQTVWQILRQWMGRKLSTPAACRWLGIGRSRLYELKRRWEAIPATSLPREPIYIRSTPSSLPDRVQDFLREQIRHMKKESKVMKGHFNFSLLAQECHKEFRRRFHRNTIRRWAVREHLYKPSEDSTDKPFHRFELGGIGMLFQHDSSIHRWVPALARNTVLIATIDDHSRKIVGARLLPRDTSWHHLCVVRRTMEIHGRPLAYYTDNHMIFKPDTDTHVQFGRALKALEVELKLTGKAQPQAKGKIEKLFDYLQRRIPYLCEKHNITNLTNANHLLDQEVAYYNHEHFHETIQETPNQRWDRALKEHRSYLRPLPDTVSLDLIFGLHYQRVVTKDGFVQFAGQEWPVPEAPRRAQVTVVLRPPTCSRRPHTELTILYPGGSVQFILSRGSTKDHMDFRQDL
jgi:hypothetical protein